MKTSNRRRVVMQQHLAKNATPRECGHRHTESGARNCGDYKRITGSTKKDARVSA